MAEALENPSCIIGPEFCRSPCRQDLLIVRKVPTLTSGNFVVKDVYGKKVFEVEGFVSLHKRRVLKDAAGNAIVTMRKKMITAHERWQVFRGSESCDENLVFTAKRSSMFQLKTKLDVFLASNAAEDIPDFKVKGSLSGPCVVYAGDDDEDSKLIIAKMRTKLSVGGLLIGKSKYVATVFPNVDSAFITALTVILDEVDD